MHCYIIAVLGISDLSLYSSQLQTEHLFRGEANFSKFQVVFTNFRTKHYRLCTADKSFPQQGEIITILCGP